MNFRAMCVGTPTHFVLLQDTLLRSHWFLLWIPSCQEYITANLAIWMLSRLILTSSATTEFPGWIGFDSHWGLLQLGVSLTSLLSRMGRGRVSPELGGSLQPAPYEAYWIAFIA